MKRITTGPAVSLLTILLLIGVPGHGEFGQKPRAAEEAAAGPAPNAWTLKEAVDQLGLHPRDAYLQYVALQLWRRHDRPEVKEFETIFPISDSREPNLFSLFSGTLPLQETLQLYAMTGHEPGVRAMAPGFFAFAEKKADLPADFAMSYTAASRVIQATPSPGVAFPASVQWAPWLLPQEAGAELDKILGRAVEKTRQDQERAERDKLRRQITPIGELKGPALKSHPWEKLLAGRNPPVSFLSRCVPEDFYLVEFRSPGKLLEALETLDQWTRYLVSQATFDARSHLGHERLQRQLALETSALERPAYDFVVGEVAITGSDLFVQEGSDVTMLLRLKQPKVFQAQMDALLTRIQKQQPDVRRVQGKFLDVEYTWLSTADRTVHMFAANPLPDLHVRSTSRVAFERVLETIRGKTASGAVVRRLGDSAEYKYLRTLWPLEAGEEDGFVCLSEAFVRNLAGPRLKLTERRRLLCYNHLRMIGHAAAFYRTEQGKPAGSLREIAKADCCPGEFNHGPLVCPCGGQYTLSADGRHGICSFHGRAHSLVPCCEIPLALADGVEAGLYREYADGRADKDVDQFLTVPIAFRMQLRPERYKVESLIPFQSLLGSKELAEYYKHLPRWLPEPLDALPVPKGNLFTLNMRLPTEEMFKDLEEHAEQLLVREKLRQQAAWLPNVAGSLAGAPLAPFPAAMPWQAVSEPDVLKAGSDVRDAVAGLFNQYPELRKRQLSRFLEKGLGNQLGLHVYDARIMFDMNWAAFFADLARLGREDVGASVALLPAFFLGPLVAPVYLAVPVRDTQIVDEYLDSLDEPLASLARQRSNFGLGNEWMTPDFYKLTFKSGLKARALGIRTGAIRWRMFWARIGSGLYLTNNAAVLEDIHVAELARQKGGAASVPGPQGHAMLRLRPENWNAALPGFTLGWAEANREACYNNLGPLSSGGRAFTALAAPKPKDNLSWDKRTDEALQWADRLQGAHHFCPEGGRYLLSKDGKTVTCSVHGSSLAPRQTDAPVARSTLDRIIRAYGGFTGTLTFRQDGVLAVVIIDRKKMANPK